MPTIKIASNSQLALRKQHWTDFDAGGLPDSDHPTDVLKSFHQLIMEIASGTKKVKNEEYGFGK